MADAAFRNVNKVITDGKYNAYLSLIKGLRNGVVYVFNWPVNLQNTKYLFCLLHFVKVCVSWSSSYSFI